MAKTKSITCLSQLSNEILQNIYTVIVYNKQGKKCNSKICINFTASIQVFIENKQKIGTIEQKYGAISIDFKLCGIS